MAFEEIRAAIDALIQEIAERPEDRLVLQEQLRTKLAEMRAMGLPVPADLKQFEDDLSDDDSDDFFDNMPV